MMAIFRLIFIFTESTCLRLLAHQFGRSNYHQSRVRWGGVGFFALKSLLVHSVRIIFKHLILKFCKGSSTVPFSMVLGTNCKISQDDKM